MKCEGCGAEIDFIEGPAGKPIPAQRVKSIYRLVDSGKEKLLDRLQPKPSNPGEAVVLYINHFENCPEADRFSGRSRG